VTSGIAELDYGQVVDREAGKPPPPERDLQRIRPRDRLR
jgi:hypothetical protein